MTDERFELIGKSHEVDANYARRLVAARERFGKGVARMVVEITRLAWGPGKISPYEYLLYELGDASRISAEDRKTFIGYKGLDEVMQGAGAAWLAETEDKLGVYALLASHGLPTPRTIAAFRADNEFPGALMISGPDELADFLRRAEYPLFGKPIVSHLSLGSLDLVGYSRDNDSLLVSDGREVAVDELVAVLATMDPAEANPDDGVDLAQGYILQERLEPHPELARVVGPRVNTVRMVLLDGEAGFEPIRASWKMTSGTNFADNTWRPGNMLAGLDIETGNVLHVVSATADRLDHIAEHPDTGVAFEGLVFPMWADMRDMAVRAAATIPDMPLQGWDIAMTDQGPVILEVQAGGGNPILTQLGHNTGLLQGRYREFIRSAPKAKREGGKRQTFMNSVQEQMEQLRAQAAAEAAVAPAELPFWERPENVDKFTNRELDVRLGELMAGFEDPGSTVVVDVGCAGGRNTVPLAEAGFDVHAIDDSAAMTERTRARVAEVVAPGEADRRVRRGRMDDLSGHADGSVDLVVILGVLHASRNLAEWHRAAAEIARILRPNGRVLTASFAPGTDASGEGPQPIEGEPHLFIGPSGNPSIQLTAEETDAAMSEHGLHPVEPTVQVERERPVGTWFVVNGLFTPSG